MDSNLTIDQKIELITLASKIGLKIGCSSTDIKTVINNYLELTKTVTEEKRVNISIDNAGIAISPKKNT